MTDWNERSIDSIVNNHNYNIEDEVEIAKKKSLETPLLTSFVKHLTNGGTNHYVRKSISEEGDKRYLINFRLSRDIRHNQENIQYMKEEIQRLQLSIDQFVPSAVIAPEINYEYEDGDDLESFVNNLKQTKQQLRSFYQIFSTFLKQKQRLSYLNDKLKTAELQMRLYRRTLEFDITQINRLPEDMEWVIGQFVGDDFLGMVRRRCITVRYFPIAYDSLALLLYKWKCAELRRYLEHVYLQYDITACSFSKEIDWMSVGKIPKKKSELIALILRGKYKCSFYELQRDVFIITNILRKK